MLSVFIQTIQTLTTLTLYSSAIGVQGVQYLSDVLKHNTVGNCLMEHAFALSALIYSDTDYIGCSVEQN